MAPTSARPQVEEERVLLVTKAGFELEASLSCAVRSSVKDKIKAGRCFSG